MSEISLQPRPPVVAIMGHVDHGKSSLLDYIRKSNITAGEAGGITQHISAYEAMVTSDETQHSITFIDTPGHAAFQGMRNRGAQIADIAILIVAGDDGVKAQTIEAIKIIQKSEVPYIVAINKMDKGDSDAERVKSELMEHGVFVEGFGGTVPVVPISAKSGLGVDELLETILLVAELEGFTYNPEIPATGFVIESDLDQQRGISATLILKDGVLNQGDIVVVDDSMAGTRILEDFLRQRINKALPCKPVIITGFTSLPSIGSRFRTYTHKKTAEHAVQEFKALQREIAEQKPQFNLKENQIAVPVIIKCDVSGTQEALEEQIIKTSDHEVIFKIIKSGVGDINESDIKLALSDPQTIIIGFHVGSDPKIHTMPSSDTVTMHHFDIIYKMLEWLQKERDVRRPFKETRTVKGTALAIKTFSSQKNKHVVGCRIESGTITVKDTLALVRKQEIIDQGKVTNIQKGKLEVSEIREGDECGMQIEMNTIPQYGDKLESFIIENKQ